MDVGRISFLSLIFSITLGEVGFSPTEALANNEPFCFGVFTDGQIRDLTNICQQTRVGQPVPFVPAPQDSELDEASSLYNEVYCDVLAQGSTPEQSVEEARLVTSIFLNIRGENGDAFSPGRTDC